MTIVLDASAVLALLFAEAGADHVRASLDGAVLGAVNECEVATKLIKRGTSPDLAVATIAALGVGSIPFDSHLALAAARLEPLTRSAGLSLGDRCCLALAAALSAPVLTGDRAWERIAGAAGVRVQLIR